ncbi:MAG: substrate-binding domain-containing protein [Alphaproteobacteria bacterium]|nr:substrate-binding domain-containing protein [Alphaproteobacteria bacterium]
MAQRAGVELVRTVVGCDVVALIVNADNPVEALRVEDAAGLLSGGVVDWERWGLHAPVRVFGRAPSSGTHAVVREALLAGDYSPSAMALSGHSQVIDAVRETPGGLGYVSMAALELSDDGVRVLGLIGEDGEVLWPDDPEHVASLRYPLVRPLLQLSAGEPEGAVADFLEFGRSPEGQSLAASMGFERIPEAWEPR